MSDVPIQMVPLRDFIEIVDEVNTAGDSYPVMGLNKEKTFMPTVANLGSVDLKKYKVVRGGFFAYSGMQTGRDECIRIAYYQESSPVLISPAYTTFRIKESAGALRVLPEYLMLLFSRCESDRFGAFISDSSVRSNLDWPRFLDICIPLPEVEIQQNVVNAWSGLATLNKENETLAEPLMALCMSFLARLRKNYPEIAIGDGYIEPCSEENGERCDLSSLRGISIKKAFIETKANMEGVSLRSYKVVHPHEFAFVTVTSRNGGKISLALNTEPLPVIVSATYEVFRCNTDKLVPEYLFLWMLKPEFDRYARFHSWGSARETFSFDDMKRVKIPIPPLEIQQAVVDLYKCARESKEIAEAAVALKKAVTPALAQYAIHS